MAKEIIYDNEVRKGLLNGVKKLYKAVSSTMGPNGQNVLIQGGLKSNTITKDGVTVANAIVLKDSIENMGNIICKQSAQNTNKAAGDGTTTATVLAYHMFKQGLKALDKKHNPIDIQRGMEKAVRSTLTVLKGYSIPVNNESNILSIARISSNNDDGISHIVAEAVNAVGIHGGVKVIETKNADDHLQIVNGMEYDKGLVSPYLVNNKTRGVAEYDNPKVLLFDGVIENIHMIPHVLEYALTSPTDGRSPTPVVIVCEDYNKEALDIIINNNVRGAIKLLPVKGPGFGDRGRELLEDLAVILGANIIRTDEDSLKNINFETDPGTCDKIIVSRETTTIMEGHGDGEAIQNQIDNLQEQIKHLIKDFDIGKTAERLANLSGGIAIIRVGGNSETEVKERKDRFDDAVGATRAALEDGVLPGGGITLYKASEAISASIDVCVNKGEKSGFKAVLKALKAPYKIITKNSNIDGKLILDKLEGGMTYNARNGEVGDAMEIGIIDPTKVEMEAVQNAVSVAGILLTAGTAIFEEGGKNNEIGDYGDLLGGM